MRLNPFKKEHDPFAASRYDGVFKGVRVRERKKPWVLRHRWAWIGLIIIGLLAGVAGYGWYRFNKFKGDVTDKVIEVTEPPAEDAPFNVLLIGSDSRDGLTDAEKEDLAADDVAADGSAIEGERADTLIVAHIDPGTNEITMVQFPRDLYVPIASGGKAKINSALEKGGNNMINTVEDLTGIKINNYVKVNIAGFRDIVDAIDGVKLCITEAIPFDEATGLEITEEELPLVPFDGDRALRFVRSRSFATGDFARIQNQQRFLSAAVNKVLSLGTLINLGRINSLVDAVGKNLKVDSELADPRDLLALGKRFRAFDPEKYEAYTVPNLGISENEAGSVVLPDLATMEVMFEAIRNNESPAEADNAPDIDPSTVSVRVYNGTFEDGVAKEAQQELLQAISLGGKTVSTIDPTNADKIDYKRSVIRYNPDADNIETKLKLMEAAIPDIPFRKGGTLGSEDFSIIVGKDGFSAETVIQITAIELPPPGQVPAECR